MKTKISENKFNITSVSDEIVTHYLDTIQVTLDCVLSETRQSLYYKAIRKEATDRKLIQMESIVKALDYKDSETYLKRFERVKTCMNLVIQDGDQMSLMRCNVPRICQNCARAESAQRTEDFKKDLTTLANDNGLYFVTLTAPTCRERELRGTIDRRIKMFAKVKNNMRKRYNMHINGLRKLECTYNKEKDRYHPHFHFLIQGYTEAILLRDLWLKQHEGFSKEYKAQIGGQDVREIKVTIDDATNLVEVFKYATKGVVTNTIEAHAEYHILRAIDRRRIFQTFGKLKKTRITKMEDTERAKIDWQTPKQEIYKYEPKCKDWTSAQGNRLVNLTSVQVKNDEERKKRKKAIN